MVQVHRRHGAAKHRGHHDLTPRRCQQVVTANHDIDMVAEVVDDHGQLVCRLAKPVAQQQVATLERRDLVPSAVSEIVELDAGLVQHQSARRRLVVRYGSGATGARIPELAAAKTVGGDVATRAAAGVYGAGACQRRQRGIVNVRGVTLADRRGQATGHVVRFQSQPCQIGENRRRVRRPCALRVVILDAEDHRTAERTCDAPDKHRIHGVPKVEMARRRRRETGAPDRWEPCLQSRAEQRAISLRHGGSHSARICACAESATMVTRVLMAYDKAYFDKWYRSRQHRVRTPAQIRRIVAFTLAAAEYVLDRPVRTVLDVGAGEGHWQPILKALRPKLTYVGVEPSTYAVTRFGRRRGLMLGSVERLGELQLHERYPEGFDLVICCGVLNYVPTRVLGSALEQLQVHTGGLAWLELFTKYDEIEGDIAALKPRPPEWYRQRFSGAGLIPCGLHLYAPRDLAAGLTALETGRID